MMRWMFLLLMLVLPPGMLRAEQFGELEQAVVKAVNEVRIGKGLPALEPNGELAGLARRHSEEMAQKKKLSHDGFQNRFAVVREKIPDVKSMGENVAMNVPREDLVADTVKNWMNSAPHRANILRRTRLTGVGIVRAGDGTYYFTQLFAQ